MQMDPSAEIAREIAREKMLAHDIPPVDPADMRTMWVGMRRIQKRLPPPPKPVPGQPPHSVGIDPTSFFAHERRLQPSFQDDLYSLIRRYWLLDALVERGVLKEYQTGDDLTDAVMHAAATMTASMDDVAEAMILLTLSRENDPALIQQGKDELRKAGKEVNYNPDDPIIDRKFLAWLKSGGQP